jgi:L-aminopeptidase/D-esterase-like protein
MGARGAGRNARVGKLVASASPEPAGQGAAFAQHGQTKVLVLTVVNAIGAIVNRDGRVVRGYLRADGTRAGVQYLASQTAATPPSGTNTTLTAVITNQRVGARELTQLGRQVHASMARAIQPFHTANDGDTLIAASTWEIENDALPATMLGALASELAWDAVLASF